MSLKISLHPKLAAVLDALVGGGLLFVITRLDTLAGLLVWFLARVAWWALLTHRLVFYPPMVRRGRHLASLIFFQFGALAFMAFTDWRPAWLVGGLLFVSLPALSFWLLPAEREVLSFIVKPERRSRFLLTVMGLSGWWSGIFGAAVFQLVPALTWWLPLVGSVVSAAVGWWWWSEYELIITRRQIWSALTLGLVMLNGSVVFLWWPLGPFVSGLLLAWIWYLLWLILRFYQTSEGINWKKQARFLIINVILMILYLGLVVRWK